MPDGQLNQKKAAIISLPAPGHVTYATDASGALYQVDSSGNVTPVGGGSAPIANDTLLGNVSGGVAAPVALTQAQVLSLLGVMACAEDVWGAGAASFVASKVPTLTNVVFRSRCANGLTQELSAATIAGSGASAQDATATGGVIASTTGANVASRAYFTNAGKVVLVPSLKTAKYAVVTRAKIVSVNATCLVILGDATDTSTTDNYWGVRGATSTAHYSFVVGGVTQDTGVAFDAAYHTIALVADGTNVTLWNVDTGVQIGTSIAQSNAAAVAGHFRFDVLNQGTASAAASAIDEAMFITEQAA